MFIYIRTLYIYCNFKLLNCYLEEARTKIKIIYKKINYE